VSKLIANTSYALLGGGGASAIALLAQNFTLGPIGKGIIALAILVLLAVVWFNVTGPYCWFKVRLEFLGKDTKQFRLSVDASGYIPEIDYSISWLDLEQGDPKWLISASKPIKNVGPARKGNPRWADNEPIPVRRSDTRIAILIQCIAGPDGWDQHLIANRQADGTFKEEPTIIIPNIFEGRFPHYPDSPAIKTALALWGALIAVVGLLSWWALEPIARASEPPIALAHEVSTQIIPCEGPRPPLVNDKAPPGFLEQPCVPPTVAFLEKSKAQVYLSINIAYVNDGDDANLKTYCSHFFAPLPPNMDEATIMANKLRTDTLAFARTKIATDRGSPFAAHEITENHCFSGNLNTTQFGLFMRRQSLLFFDLVIVLTDNQGARYTDFCGYDIALDETERCLE